MERPKNREHGDYATNVALQLRQEGRDRPRASSPSCSPSELAATRRHRVGRRRRARASSTSRVDAGAQGVVAAPDRRGRARRTAERPVLRGHAVNLEFISANPTGPLHLGHTRWAAVGDAIARVLEAAGAEVTREFYINDRGAQMDQFGAVAEAAALGQPVPEDGYHGAYVADLAQQIVAEHPDILDLPEEERLAAFREAGYELQLAEQQDAARRLPHPLRRLVLRAHAARGAAATVEHGLERLREQGHVFEADGALWMRTTDFGDDKDRVLVRANGELTYFASDTAYYVDKRARGFDVCIYLLGADHHGYVGRLKAMAACAGDDPEHEHRGADRPAGEDPARTARRSGCPSGPAPSSRSTSSST